MHAAACAGKSMHAIWALYCHKPCPAFGISAWILVFAGMQLLLSQARRIAATSLGTDALCPHNAYADESRSLRLA